MGLMKIARQTGEARRYRTATDPQAFMIHNASSQSDFVPLSSSSSPSEISGTSTEELYKPNTLSRPRRWSKPAAALAASFSGAALAPSANGPSDHAAHHRRLVRSVSEKAPACVSDELFVQTLNLKRNVHHLPQRSASTVPSTRRPIFDSIGPDRRPGDDEDCGFSLSSDLSDDMQRSENRRRFFKTGAKKTLPIPVPVPSGWDRHTWISPECCVWQNLSRGQTVRLEASYMNRLSGKEYAVLQKQRLSKLHALPLNISVAIPKVSGSSKKVSKRFGVKKPRSNTVSITNLFDHFKESGKKEKPPPPVAATADDLIGVPGTRWVFGLPLHRVLFNDQIFIRQRSQPNLPIFSTDPTCEDYVQLVGDTSTDNEDKSTSPGETRSMEGAVGGTEMMAAAVMAPILSAEEMPFSPHSPQTPYIVKACIDFLERYGMGTLGLFRVGGSKKRVRLLREEFDIGVPVVLGPQHNTNDVAALLKEFFRELPAPLLTRQLYSSFLETAKTKDSGHRLLAIKYLVSLLPVPNRDLLFLLLHFLHRVSEHSNDTCTSSGTPIPGNKMDASNLATVFGPNILHNLSGSAAGEEFGVDKPDKANKTSDVIEIVRVMILHVQDIFEVTSNEQDDILRTMAESNMDDVAKVLSYRARALSAAATAASSLGVPEGGAARATSTSPRMSTTATEERLYRSKSSPFFAVAGVGDQSDAMSVSSYGGGDGPPSTPQTPRHPPSSTSEEGDGEDYGNYVQLKEPEGAARNAPAGEPAAFYVGSSENPHVSFSGSGADKAGAPPVVLRGAAGGTPEPGQSPPASPNTLPPWPPSLLSPRTTKAPYPTDHLPPRMPAENKGPVTPPLSYYRKKVAKQTSHPPSPMRPVRAMPQPIHSGQQGPPDLSSRGKASSSDRPLSVHHYGHAQPLGGPSAGERRCPARTSAPLADYDDDDEDDDDEVAPPVPQRTDAGKKKRQETLV